MSHLENPTLHPHQVIGRDFLAARARAFLWDEPGVGKSCQAASALVKIDGPAVIVCPNVAIGVWVREMATWAPDYEVVIQRNTKQVDAPTGRQVLLTTYERAKVGPGRFGIVIDEAHALKNERTQRSKRARELVQAGRSFVWQLTGSPILRWPDDLWGQLAVMGLAAQTYRTKTNFCTAFGGVYGMNGMEWNAKRIKPTAYDPIRNFFLRRLRSEVMELPERTSEEWWVDLPKRLAARFADVVARFPPDEPTWESSAAGGELAAALADLSAIKAEASLKSIQELEPTPDNPVVVFTAHKDAAKIVAHAMGWPVIHGDVSPDDRTALAHAFQNGAYSGIVLTIQAGGVAITLTRAQTMVFVSESYVGPLNDQAADRVYRIGQERCVRTIKVRAESPLEYGLQRVLRKKAPFATIG